jgi:ABC-type polysaccharide/polyol phosphate transport system ATPase subunit
MALENATATSPPDHHPRPPAERPLAIQVKDLEKAFRIPTHRIDSLKERATHPFARREYRELQALDSVSFEIHQGEFFGIVGRNGSGKSTLLKLLASIYRADRGTIRLAGRLAPFIELGVGFNVEMTARENVALNGVMMGLTPRDARQRLDAIIRFAELEEFVDLKLKNYSSGMLVRLAFSTMLQADADVLLIDEVLAVGDAAFQQKCADAFRRMKGEGKTIVLVTHEMATVEAYCHRAMLIDSGRIAGIGEPMEIAKQYLRLNFERGAGEQGEMVTSGGDGVRLLDAWIEDDDGRRATSVEKGRTIRVRVEIEILREVSALGVGFVLANANGLGLFPFGTPIDTEDGSGSLKPGQRVTVNAELENHLVPGRYSIHCGVQRYQGGGEEAALYAHNALDFLVFGEKTTHGIVSLPYEIEAVVRSPER